MADLNIPNLNKRPDKFIFKKKLTLRRKSKRRLITESIIMFVLGLFLVYVNNLIPNKNLLLQNIPINLNKSYILVNELFLYLYEIFLLVFILISAFFILILFIGSFSRLLKVVMRKKRKN